MRSRLTRYASVLSNARSHRSHSAICFSVVLYRNNASHWRTVAEVARDIAATKRSLSLVVGITHPLTLPQIAARTLPTRRAFSYLVQSHSDASRLWLPSRC